MKTCTLEECEEPHVARGFCKKHYKRGQKHGWDPRLWPPLPGEFQAGVPAGSKRCRDCKEIKGLDEYPDDPNGYFGKSSYCRPCANKRANKSWHSRSPEKREKDRVRMAMYSALRNFGPDGVEIAKRREAGEGCDVCGRVTIRMAIDHCHATGKVRGLLCKDCNTTLGNIRDDPQVLRALAAYLEQHAPS